MSACCRPDRIQSVLDQRVAECGVALCRTGRRLDFSLYRPPGAGWTRQRPGHIRPRERRLSGRTVGFGQQGNRVVEGDPLLNVIDDVKTVLGRSLQLGDKIKQFDASTGLFGNIPEFDSMAVVTVVTALEERFGIVIDDNEITAEVFDTVGSLSRFVEAKLGR